MTNKREILEKIKNPPYIYDEELEHNRADFSFLEKIDSHLKKDKTFILEMINQCKESFNYIDEDLKQDRNFITTLLDKNIYIFSYLDKKFLSDKSFVLPYIEIMPSLLDFVDITLLEDNKFITYVLLEYGYGLKYATKEQQSDKEIVLKAMAYDDWQIEYISKSLMKDKKLIIQLHIENSSTFYYADESLKKDKEFILEILDTKPETKFLTTHSHYWSILESMDSSFLKDKEIVLKALSQDSQCLDFVDETLKNNRDFILEVIREGCYIEVEHRFNDDDYNINLDLLNDKSFILKAIEVAPYPYIYDDLISYSKWKEDKDILSLSKEKILKWESSN